MNTPICDFVEKYANDSNKLRLHMPGHKGFSLTGLEKYDITEIPGADSLYEASGIIAQSEQNASKIFDAGTFFSTEGSSLCIRAMLYLALNGTSMENGPNSSDRPWILAGRNAHKTFLSAAALLDFDIEWIYPKKEEDYLSCEVLADEVEERITSAPSKPIAVYITSPDYLGNTVDVKAIAKVCHKHGVLLLVDNAHGAYLKFLPKSKHPIDLGADMCCDSAHKTLPALTGAAYLHVAKHMLAETELSSAYKTKKSISKKGVWLGKREQERLLFSREQVKNALALFGSTSPSYLILKSLDAVNEYLSWSYITRLSIFVGCVEALKKSLIESGYELIGDEPLKITIRAKDYGYTGYELAEELAKKDIICEFCDPDYLVLMLVPEIYQKGLMRIKEALMDIPSREKIAKKSPKFRKLKQVMSVRKAMFLQGELLPVEECEGRILQAATVGCPPAVPIAICGERLDAHAIACFRYYGIDSVAVIKQQNTKIKDI